MSVVLLTNNSNRGQALAHLIIRAGLDLKLVVVEDASFNENANEGILHKLRLLVGPAYRKVKNFLTLSKEDRAALRFEEGSIYKANKIVDDYIHKLGVLGRPVGVEYLETPSLNEATVVTAVKNAQPDVCVVLGTSIIRPRLIDIPKVGMINAHTSILPEYRGSRSEFWQCYNEDYKNVGVTLHLIDNGIDTGNILFQKRQEVSNNPDPNALRANNTLATLENYTPVIQALLKNTVEPKQQGTGTTPTYKFRDITLEKRLKLYKRILKRNAQ